MTQPIPTLAMTTALSILIGFRTSLSAAPEVPATQEVKVTHSAKLLNDYLAVADALYKDDLETVKKASFAIENQSKDNPLSAAAAKISSTKTIASARTSFNALSAAAITLAKSHSEYKVAHCPMANSGKGGSWLQKSADTVVNNPYFGAKMAHCGSFKK